MRPFFSVRGGSTWFTMVLILSAKVCLDAYLQRQALVLEEQQQQRSHDELNTRTSRVESALKAFRLRNETPQKSNYAYAFVIGGCSPDDGLYKGFIYNTLVAAQMLREEGSSADVVVLIQMSIKTNATTLPQEDVRALSAMNIHIHYLQKSQHESFYDTVLNKFQILGLTNYQRVFLLDGDVMPLSNLDYFFHLSVAGVLKENVIVSGAIEPANGGIFMLQPGMGETERIQEIIRQREIDSLSIQVDYLGYKFDPIRGWGHPIVPPDEWVARRGGERGTNWTFHFAFSDQGLLYHWTKYEKKSVSIVFEDFVENWGAAPNGTVLLQETLKQPFQNYSKPRIRIYNMCHKYLCDIMHFTGSKKPWLRRPPGDLSEATKEKDALHLWWYSLQKVDKAIGMNLDYVNWKRWQNAPLGGYASLADMQKHAEASANATK